MKPNPGFHILPFIPFSNIHPDQFQGDALSAYTTYNRTGIFEVPNRRKIPDAGNKPGRSIALRPIGNCSMNLCKKKRGVSLQDAQIL